MNVQNGDLITRYVNSITSFSAVGDRRRKSLFPVNLTSDMETRLNENPTAQDIRKIMVPARRQVRTIKCRGVIFSKKRVVIST